MNIKRLLTGIIGFPIVLAVLVFANKYLIDVMIAIVAAICIYEYSKCAQNKEIKIVSWLGYVSCFAIAIAHVFPANLKMLAITIVYPVIIFILFLHVVLTDMKITFKDIAFSLIGYIYIIVFLMFFALMFGKDSFCWNLTGKLAVWYILFPAWMTDIAAYFVGKNLGKHKFSKVSPNKTIEGCIGGILWAAISGTIFTFCINKFAGTCVPYTFSFIVLSVLSVIGQLGDFSASVIKRYFEVKDYSNLFPGHGGMLDRIDSVIFIAPFAYIIFTITSLVL